MTPMKLTKEATNPCKETKALRRLWYVSYPNKSTQRSASLTSGRTEKYCPNNSRKARKNAENSASITRGIASQPAVTRHYLRRTEGWGRSDLGPVPAWPTPPVRDPILPPHTHLIWVVVPKGWPTCILLGRPIQCGSCIPLKLHYECAVKSNDARTFTKCWVNRRIVWGVMFTSDISFRYLRCTTRKCEWNYKPCESW